MIRFLIVMGIGIICLVILTQIMIPILIGGQIFWIFRKSSSSALFEAEKKKKEAEQELEIAKLRVETETIKLQTHMVESSAWDENIDMLESSKKEKSCDS